MAQNDNDHDESELKSGYRIDKRQQEVIDGLTGAHDYGRQSKWETFKALPVNEKLPYFVQHFLLGVGIVVVIVAIVVSLAWQMLFGHVDIKLGVQAINMQSYSAGFERLKLDFDKAAKVDDERVVDVGATMTITKDGYSKGSGMMDDSAKLLAMASTGDINVLISSAKDVPVLTQRDAANKLKGVLPSDQLLAARQSGRLVDTEGNSTDDAGKAVGVLVDADGSAQWGAIQGLPEEAVLMFCNISDQQHKDWALKFYDYLMQE